MTRQLANHAQNIQSGVDPHQTEDNKSNNNAFSLPQRDAANMPRRSAVKG